MERSKVMVSSPEFPLSIRIAAEEGAIAKNILPLDLLTPSMVDELFAHNLFPTTDARGKRHPHRLSLTHTPSERSARDSRREWERWDSGEGLCRISPSARGKLTLQGSPILGPLERPEERHSADDATV